MRHSFRSANRRAIQPDRVNNSYKRWRVRMRTSALTR